jgi:hypothetical protein
VASSDDSVKDRTGVNAGGPIVQRNRLLFREHADAIGSIPRCHDLSVILCSKILYHLIKPRREPTGCVAFHSAAWKASLFGDHHMHGPEGVRFYTRLKTITTRWPTGMRAEAEFVMPTMG